MLPLILLGIGSIVSWGAWIFVMVRFDPFVGKWIAHGLFYASLALALQGTLMLAGMFWYKHKYGRTGRRAEVGIIARQAALFVCFIIVVFILSARDILKWWNIAPLAFLTFTIELFFISLSRKTHSNHIYASK